MSDHPHIPVALLAEILRCLLSRKLCRGLGGGGGQGHSGPFEEKKYLSLLSVNEP
jgi:hypothetical protein